MFTARVRKPLLLSGVISSSFLLSLALAEGLARLFLSPPQRTRVQNKAPPPGHDIDSSTNQIDQQESSRLFVQTQTGLRLRPNTKVTVSHSDLSKLDFTIETNALGYRNREISYEKTIPRYLFLGDSITLGAYLPENDTFVRRIESLAQREAHPIDAINAGVSGIGVSDYLNILRETGLTVDPNVVVINFYLNDHRPSMTVSQIQLPRPFSLELFSKPFGSLYFRRIYAGANRTRSRFSRTSRSTQTEEVFQ